MTRSLLLLAAPALASSAHAEQLLSTVFDISKGRSEPDYVRFTFEGLHAQNYVHHIHSLTEDIGIVYDVPVEPFRLINDGLLRDFGGFSIGVDGWRIDVWALFRNYTSQNFTVASDVNQGTNRMGLKGLGIHLSRIEFETTAYSPFVLEPFSITETHYTYRLYGEDGVVPEPCSLVIVLAAMSLVSIRRR